MIEEPTEELAEILLAGVPTAILWRHLDALLVWLGNPDNPHVAPLDGAIVRSGLTRPAASGRAYDMLDRMLFSDASAPPQRVLGLANPFDMAAAKLRYRRLIQAYHPDRHPARAREFTERLEQINVAYAILEQSKREAAVSAKPPTAAPSSVQPKGATRHPRRHARTRRYGRRLSRFGAFTAEWLRLVLGNAATFETRFFTLLLLVCALILGSLLYQG